jgi:L-alanine-DL-glutamate epimerase-like enolase superfamily enzyme
MHLLTAIPNAGKYLEFSIEDETYYPWQKNIFTRDPFKVKDGFVNVTNEPGWGVEIHPEWLEKSGYMISE